MESAGMHIASVALIMLVYTAIKCALATLTARIRDQIAQHDLLVVVQQQRQAYLRRANRPHRIKLLESNAALSTGQR